jgi:hypothetical protein
VSLYLAVFDVEENEIEGVEVGLYSDFGRFREVVAELEGEAGAKYPNLMLHSDSDGEWTPSEAAALLRELEGIEAEFLTRPPLADPGEWQAEVMRSLGLRPTTLCDSFIDVDGESLIGRLKDVCRAAIRSGQPIKFQ